jgi:myo-inositol 2-dehydrogenase/D-chiro-inositol 1-dehydrogenase
MALATSTPVRLGLIGTGWIGSFHAQSIVRGVPGATLVAVADPAPGAAERVGEPLGVEVTLTDPAELIARDDIDGIVIASPASTHANLVVAAAQAGKAIFVEKPMALTLEDADRAIEAAADAGVPLQVGFNRRFSLDFAAAHRDVKAGRIGTPHLLRSLTRDPGLANPAAVKPWAIFVETLIHDFDTLNWFNEGARAVQVFAIADALVAPEFKDNGLLDTAVVSVRYDNGAIAVAEASFSAAYGYDVRGEFFGSAGMTTAGDVRQSNARLYDLNGQRAATSRSNIELFKHAYVDELISFVEAIRTGTVQGATGQDAAAALRIALASIESFTTGVPVELVNRPVRR